jgi:hypothetical protein
VVVDHFKSDKGEVRCETHHNVGVINGPSIATGTLEGDRLIIEIGTELLQRLAVGPLGKRDVGETMDVIEHQTAGAFEIKPAFFIR